MKLADEMSTAWATFAHNGDPNNALPKWEVYNVDEQPTMVFDEYVEKEPR